MPENQLMANYKKQSVEVSPYLKKKQTVIIYNIPTTLNKMGRKKNCTTFLSGWFRLDS